MDFDWKKTLPFIGALATGGVPALVAAAAGALGDALGTPVDPTAAGIDTAMKNATPEQLAALKQIDADLKTKMRAFDVQEKQISAATEQAYLTDIDSARHAHAQNMGVLRLGYFINVASYACIFGVLYGCFQVLSGTTLTIDPGIAAMIGGVIGGAVQWLMSNAAQANGFFFGSSPGSRDLAAKLGNAVGGAVQASPPTAKP
jgi:hypothetical protein